MFFFRQAGLGCSAMVRQALVASCLALAVHATAWAQSATVADTAEGGGSSGGTFFVLQAVNGQETSDNAVRASLRASYMRGRDMRIVGVRRDVPAGKVTLKLMGTQENAAPIQSIFRAVFSGGSPEFSGTVEVELEPNRSYRVNGYLDNYRREVWLEDSATGKVVGSKIAAPVDAELLKAMEGAQYLCCNLRYDGAWIGETPWPNLPFVPAGARIKVLAYSANEVSALIDGRKMRIGNEYSRQQETIQQMVGRLVVAADPRPAIAAMEPSVRDAVRAARVMPGMSREQVLIAVGRPRAETTRKLESNDWLYHLPGGEEAFLVFDDKGLVKELDASRKARSLLLMAPPEPTAATSVSAPQGAATATVPAPGAQTSTPAAALLAPPPAAAASASR